MLHWMHLNTNKIKFACLMKVYVVDKEERQTVLSQNNKTSLFII